MLEIESESGLLARYARNSTYMFTLECSTNYACISLPFPDYDNLFANLKSN